MAAGPFLPLQSQETVGPSSPWALRAPFLPPSIFKDPGDYTGPTWVTQGSLKVICLAILILSVS